jgi:hypothetical protein
VSLHCQIPLFDLLSCWVVETLVLRLTRLMPGGSLF